MNAAQFRMFAVLVLILVGTQMLLCQSRSVKVYVFQDTSATDGVESGYADTLTFGYDVLATNCPDLALGETELPPYPPAGVFDARFTDAFLDTPCLGQGQSIDYRPWGYSDFVFTLAGGDGSLKSIRLRWDTIATSYFCGLFVSNDAGISYSMDTQDSAIFTRIQYLNKFMVFRGFIDAVPESEPVPKGFELGQNYPNPFNPSTTISYTLPAQSLVTLKVFNVLGQEVAVLVNGIESPGTKSVRFVGSPFPSGAYFYRLQAGSHSATKMLMSVK
jgi:hypothetical protein